MSCNHSITQSKSSNQPQPLQVPKLVLRAVWRKLHCDADRYIANASPLIRSPVYSSMFCNALSHIHSIARRRQEGNTSGAFWLAVPHVCSSIQSGRCQVSGIRCRPSIARDNSQQCCCMATDKLQRKRQVQTRHEHKRCSCYRRCTKI